MTNPTNSDFELEIIRAALEGKTADFRNRVDSSGNPVNVVIQGDLIRNLLLRLPLPSRSVDLSKPFAVYPTTSAGVRVRGVHIEGVIDISDNSGPEGNGCFPLLLEDCVLLGTDAYDDPAARPGPALDAKHTRISRLVLKNCRAGFIDLTDAEILGDLDLEGLQPLLDGGQCRVEARNIRIDGSLKAADAKLNLKQKKLEKTEATLVDYALSLTGAEIAGSVLLRPGFVANGGVSVSNACIKEDLWADGAHLIAQGNFALRAQSARIDGIVGLTCLHTRSPQTDASEPKKDYQPPQRFQAEGAISFLGADLGTLMLIGAALRRASGERDNWLACSLAAIKQTVTLQGWKYQDEQGNASVLPFEADYAVWFEGARIMGALQARGAKFQKATDEAALVCTNLQLNGDLILTSAEAGNVSLQGARLASDLFLSQTRFLSINAQDIKVQGSVYWWGELTRTGTFRGACIEGELSLGRDQHTPLKLVKDKGSSPTVIFEDANVSRDLKIKGVTVSRVSRLDWTKYPSFRVRAKRLECYENWRLCEAIFETAGDSARESAIVSFMMDRRNGAWFPLDGLSNSVRKFNSQAGLRLDTEKQASDYLKFFCAHVWAEPGAFRIVESLSELLDYTQKPTTFDEQISPVQIKLTADKQWQAEAYVLYAQELYKASFLINSSGRVEMVEDQPVGSLEGEPTVVYMAPVRIIRAIPPEQPNDLKTATVEIETHVRRWPAPSAIDSSESWVGVEIGPERVNVLKHELIELVEFGASPTAPDRSKPVINLKGFRVGSLDDNHGMNWGDGLTLALEGFQYARFEATETSAVKKSDISAEKAFNTNVPDSQRQKGVAQKGIRRIKHLVTLPLEKLKSKRDRPVPVWQHRLEWLNKQYSEIPPKRVEFKPQPYEQLARVFRTEGNHGFALEILIEKFRLERQTQESRLKRIGLWIYDRVFGYGQLWGPIFRTFLFFWLVGWVGVEIADRGRLDWPVVGYQGSLAVPFLAISEPVLVVDATPVSTVALTDKTRKKDAAPIEGESVTSSHAGDLVKEIRCGDEIEPALYALDVFVPLLDLKQESRCSISSEHSALPWRVGKSVYAIFGWIITSGLILTLSRAVQRQAER